MGVYHFMGLGLSVGAVTASISYLAERYRRDNPSDKEFFALSGELNQEGKPGDMQALVLFTTPEVRQGQQPGLCQPCIVNPLGQRHGQKRYEGDSVSQIIRQIMQPDLRTLSGGRQEINTYWCDINRSDLGLTFDRVARVLAAAKPHGDLGKEVWINLTGGSNVVNQALQLAAALYGGSARLYYLQTDDTKLARPSLRLADIGTPQDCFWIELPIIFLDFKAGHRAVLEELEATEIPLTEETLLSRLKGGRLWELFSEMEAQGFRRLYLVPLRSQQLILLQDVGLNIGPRWKVLKRYYTLLSDLTQGESKTLKDLETEEWFHVETWSLR